MPPSDADNQSLSRESLSQCVERVLRHPSGAKPAILLAHLPGGRVVVKDFCENPWLVRQLYGRWVVGHEARVYARLRGVAGVPALRGRIDAFALAVDYVEGATLKALPRGDIPADAFDRLGELLDRLHARGVVHFDCHQKTNVVLAPDGRPHLVDFATALWVGTSWLARRCLIPLLGRADRLGLLKLKARYRPESLAPAEVRRLRRAEWLGWLWPRTAWRRMWRSRRARKRMARKAAQRAPAPDDY